MDPVLLLRDYLGERIPDGGSEDDTFFTDAELEDMITSNPYEVVGAAVTGWAAKAGEYARLIDINESGGQRLLSQKYRQAAAQLKFFQDMLTAQIAADAATVTAAGRSAAGPKVIDLHERCNPGIVLWANRFHRFPPLTPQDPRFTNQ